MLLPCCRRHASSSPASPSSRRRAGGGSGSGGSGGEARRRRRTTLPIAAACSSGSSPFQKQHTTAHSARRAVKATAAAVAAEALPPMDAALEALVRRVHAAPARAAIYATGGGAQGVAWLLGVPGASATVLEVVVPYSRGALVQLLGQEPESYCSAEAVLSLARAAYARAAALSAFGDPVVGLAAACALASEPPKRGAHRAYVAAHGGDGTRLAALHLAKGARGRWDEEQLVGRLLLRVLAEAVGADDPIEPPLPLLSSLPPSSSSPPPPQQAEAAARGHQHAAADELECSVLPPPAEPLAELLGGGARCVEYAGGRVAVDAPRGGKLYLPGSFNPLHDGHRALLRAAADAAGRPHADAAFELAVRNADKGQLELGDVRARVAQFVAAQLPVVVTTAPLYVDKAALLPNSTFVVGYDTAVRLVNARYYGGSDAVMAAVFAQLRAAGARFLVAGRADADGTFRTLLDVRLPDGAADLFAAIPEEAFKSGLSSTALRAAGRGL